MHSLRTIRFLFRFAGLLASTTSGIALEQVEPQRFDWRGEAKPGVVLPQPSLFVGSALLSFDATCRILHDTMAAGTVAEATMETCTFSSEPFFVMARARAGRLESFRFKLNTTTAEERDGLEQLQKLIAVFHQRVGWPVPKSFSDVIVAGTNFTCQIGPLNYQFFRERGEIPRYNAIVRIQSIRPQRDIFSPYQAVC